MYQTGDIPIKTFTMYDFEECYYDMVEYCYKHGFDTELDGGKKIREIDAIIYIKPDAVQQILAKKIPKYAPCQKYLVQDYVDQFLRSKEELRKDEHVYTYPGLCLGCVPNVQEIDQMQAVENAIKLEQQSSVQSSNRHCVMVNMPDYVNEAERPCLQCFYLKRIHNNRYQLRIIFRSNDLCTAFTSNAIGILTFVNERIMKQCDCVIEDVVWHSLSMHIYHTDFTAAETIVNRPKLYLAEHEQLRQAIISGSTDVKECEKVDVKKVEKTTNHVANIRQKLNNISCNPEFFDGSIALALRLLEVIFVCIILPIILLSVWVYFCPNELTLDGFVKHFALTVGLCVFYCCVLGVYEAKMDNEYFMNK